MLVDDGENLLQARVSVVDLRLQAADIGREAGGCVGQRVHILHLLVRQLLFAQEFCREVIGVVARLGEICGDVLQVQVVDGHLFQGALGRARLAPYLACEPHGLVGRAGVPALVERGFDVVQVRGQVGKAARIVAHQAVFDAVLLVVVIHAEHCEGNDGDGEKGYDAYKGPLVKIHWETPFKLERALRLRSDTFAQAVLP